MSVIRVDVKSRVPIYEQIISSVKKAVLGGLLLGDELLPSVRSLALELTINPNTIQKAYAELERQGIIYSVPGKGNFVSPNTHEIENQHREELKKKLGEIINEALRSGMTREDIMEILEKGKEY